MKKIMVVFGTRPEAIKMCPLIHELKSRDGVEVRVCVTGQHREQLDQVLKVFGVVPDYDLNIMTENQTLFDITTNVMSGMSRILYEDRPDIMLVHGDTTTAFASAVSAFYYKIPIGHVEAGLRTYDLDAPFPEEFNRQCIAVPTKWNFAPTEWCRGNLLQESRFIDSIFVTGNTVIDAMKTTVRSDYTDENLEWAKDSRLILLTCHRRESIGEPMRQIFRAVQRVIAEHDDIKIIFPVHRNPEVRKIALNYLIACPGHYKIKLIEPMDVVAFHNAIVRSYMVLTDSGGVQEEATALGKPTLVLREKTERPEGIDAGVLKLVGTDEQVVYEEFTELLNNSETYEKMANARNPYGDGHASERIADILMEV